MSYSRQLHFDSGPKCVPLEERSLPDLEVARLPKLGVSAGPSWRSWAGARGVARGGVRNGAGCT